MTYATPRDVAEELRGSTSVSAVEEIQWQKWLDRVERTIHNGFKARGYDLDTQVAADNPTVADVIDVEVAAVIRKVWQMRAAEAVTPGTSRTQSRTVDDATISNTDRNDSRVSLDYDPLAPTDAEWTSLLPVKPKRSRVFSVMPI